MNKTLKLSLAALALFAIALALNACSSSKAEGEQPASVDADEAVASPPWIFPADEIHGVDQGTVGTGPQTAVVLTAAGQRPSRRVAVYLHSWSPLPPSTQSDPIRALVRAGYTVIYPAYQDREMKVADSLADAVTGIRTALEELESPPERLVALGPNVGGALAFDLAAVAAERGLPPLAAAAALSPGREPAGKLPRPDYGNIPASTRLLIAELPGSPIPGTRAEGRRMLRLATAVPPGQKRQARLAAPKREGGRSVVDWAPILDFLEGEN